ncbi:hypothetical protein HU200_041441 [Digitaria exilis]|uniref:Uncharacterized protein n=1 Tax=Digitaria exilis TaxID=1010633 RepID=A0A835EDS3_9POAL|nr:hypothetical protein HU200_041441 [Digitaria exilis]
MWHVQRKTEPKDDDKIRRSSDTAPAPRRITGKKHARTRSFSSSITTTTSNTRSDVVGRRRAVSQEPPPSSEPQAAVDVTKDNGRVGPAGSAAAARTTTATARPKTSSSLHRKSSVKGHGSAKPKLPRSLPRPASSGGFEALGREVVLPVVTGEAALVQSCSSEYAANGETPKGLRGRGEVAERDGEGVQEVPELRKKNRGREVTVIECASPSVSSLADDDSGSGGWQSAGSIKPRMGSSDAASDDTEHGYPVSSPRASCSLQSLVAASPAKSELAEISPQEKSPKAHRSFFSFRSLNCGRG